MNGFKLYLTEYSEVWIKWRAEASKSELEGSIDYGRLYLHLE